MTDSSLTGRQQAQPTVTDDVFLERASVHRCLAEILVHTCDLLVLQYMYTVRGGQNV
jgi:hypothetical protein